MGAASVHRSGEKRAIRRMRHGVLWQQSAEVEPAKPLERCALFCRAARGETLHLKGMAEEAGFEPAIRFPVYTLSRRAPSTTRPPLRRGALYSARRQTQRGRHVFVSACISPPDPATRLIHRRGLWYQATPFRREPFCRSSLHPERWLSG
jgi:hypothetical protein